MKKLVTLFIILLFGFTSSGASLQLHYCCGKLKSITWSMLQNEDCCSGNKTASDCCETQSVSAKQTDDHSLYTLFPGSKAPIEASGTYSNERPALIFIVTESGPVYHPSPPLSSHLFLLHCVFRI